MIASHHSNQKNQSSDQNHNPNDASSKQRRKKSEPIQSLLHRRNQVSKRIQNEREQRAKNRWQIALMQKHAISSSSADQNKGDVSLVVIQTLRSLIKIVRQQPILSVAAISGAIALGPKRLLKMASWLLPLLRKR